MGYNPYRRSDGKFATKEEAGAKAGSDYDKALKSGDGARAKEIGDYVVEHFPKSGKAQEILTSRYNPLEGSKKEPKTIKDWAPKKEPTHGLSNERRRQKAREALASSAIEKGETFASPQTVELVYEGADGKRFTQPLSEVSNQGTLIDPDSGDDLEVVGFRNGANDSEHPIDSARVLYVDDEASTVHSQSLDSIVSDGTLIDPDSGDDLPISGFSYKKESKASIQDDETPLDAEMREQGFTRVENRPPEVDEDYLKALEKSEPPYDFHYRYDRSHRPDPQDDQTDEQRRYYAGEAVWNL